MDNCELSLKMSDEEMERIRKMLTKDKGLKLDVVEFKEYENLQQRIDKTIEVLNEYKKFCKSKLDFEKDINSPTAHQNMVYWNYCIDKLDYVLLILKDEERSKYVKNS